MATMSRPNRRASPLAAIATTLVLVVAGCGNATPSAVPTASATPTPTSTPRPTPTASPSATPAASVDQAALYRSIEDQVIAERGLQAKQRLEPTILSEDQVKARLKAQFEKDNPPDEIAVAQETLQALGLLPAGASLGQLYVDMLGSQVAGFYDPRAKQLFVVSRSGTIGATEKVTFAHEFTHALQDQDFGLQGIDVDAVGQGDRSLGRLALVEGDATLLMTRWLSRNLTAAELQELLKVDPAAQAQLEALPAILRETLLFPYQQGVIFVNSLWANGGWEAVDRRTGGCLTRRSRSSIREVPGRRDADRRRAQRGCDRPGPRHGLDGTPEDTLGEFQLSVWPPRERGAGARRLGGRRGLGRRPPGLPARLGREARPGAGDVLGHAGRRGRVPAAAAKAVTSSRRRERDRRARGCRAAGDRVVVLAASDATTLVALEAAIRALP